METKPIVFLKEVRTEMEKVFWPSRREAIRLTLIVIAVSLVIGLYIGGLDFGFTKIMELLITNAGAFDISDVPSAIGVKK